MLKRKIFRSTSLILILSIITLSSLTMTMGVVYATDNFAPEITDLSFGPSHQHVFERSETLNIEAKVVDLDSPTLSFSVYIDGTSCYSETVDNQNVVNGYQGPYIYSLLSVNASNYLAGPHSFALRVYDGVNEVIQSDFFMVLNVAPEVNEISPGPAHKHVFTIDDTTIDPYAKVWDIDSPTLTFSLYVDNALVNTFSCNNENISSGWTGPYEYSVGTLPVSNYADGQHSMRIDVSDGTDTVSNTDNFYVYRYELSMNLNSNTNDSGMYNLTTTYTSGTPAYCSRKSSSDAISFNGSQYITVNDNDAIDFGTGDFSMAIWFKTSSTKVINTIFDKRTSPDRGYHVCLYNGIPLLQMADSNGSYNFWGGNSSTKFNDGAWHMLVINVDRDSTTGIKIYVDKNLVFTGNATIRSGDISNTSPLYIGKHRDSSSYNFEGSIDNACIGKNLISASEMNRLYNLN